MMLTMIPLGVDDTTRSGGSALVVFEHRATQGVLSFLQHDFRHCFCLLRQTSSWIVCDPLLQRLHLKIIADASADDLLRHFLATGRRVACGPLLPPNPHGRLSLFPVTCVEIVKRAIGFRDPAVITPRQLFLRLNRTEGWKTYCPNMIKTTDESR